MQCRICKVRTVKNTRSSCPRWRISPCGRLFAALSSVLSCSSPSQGFLLAVFSVAVTAQLGVPAGHPQLQNRPPQLKVLPLLFSSLQSRNLASSEVLPADTRGNRVCVGYTGGRVRMCMHVQPLVQPKTLCDEHVQHAHLQSVSARALRTSKMDIRASHLTYCRIRSVDASSQMTGRVRAIACEIRRPEWSPLPTSLRLLFASWTTLVRHGVSTPAARAHVQAMHTGVPVRYDDTTSQTAHGSEPCKSGSPGDWPI